MACAVAGPSSLRYAVSVVARAPRAAVTHRRFSSIAPRRSHENPLVSLLRSRRDCEPSSHTQGIPRHDPNPAPTIPRRGAPPVKSRIKGVRQIVVVASGKGGVGKSTVAGASSFSQGQACQGD